MLLEKNVGLMSRIYMSTTPEVKERIDSMVKNNKVVVFMKGIPEQPRCGFSNAVVQIMRMHNVQYDAHNVLEDESIRQGVKDYSNWPTIPQIYIDGEFVGGCDILLQMHQSGELIDELKKVGIKSALLEAAENEKKEK
ncbi:Glutaredoxin-related protein 5, mitochondrial [Amphibalanus amphitrite]|uniref:Glutaredoxin-related protein 5, mitochondrial n=1 Tax=Amphibalanus amphitrite TaxID=1232801 RepID=A0A6A4X055_AMPAM|nr:Glutaredoxin-related protein 5, mitochondrial [Amphibalanus amphitrite]